MIVWLLTILHDESLALMDLLQIPTTNQVKCFLNKSFTSANQARKCIEELDRSEIALDKEMLEKDLEGMNAIS